MKLILLLFLALSFFSQKSECYYCGYDVIDQTLCLDNGTYTFEEKAPFSEKIELSGEYEWHQDTLVLNKEIFKEGAHKFENELKLIKKDEKLYHIYKGELSSLFFWKK